MNPQSIHALSRFRPDAPAVKVRRPVLKPLARAMPSVLLCVAFGVAVPGQGVHAQSVPTQNSAEDIEKSSEKKLNKNITTRTFDIRPGPLEPALDYFARISGINLSYDAA